MGKNKENKIGSILFDHKRVYLSESELAKGNKVSNVKLVYKDLDNKYFSKGDLENIPKLDLFMNAFLDKAESEDLSIDEINLLLPIEKVIHETIELTEPKDIEAETLAIIAEKHPESTDLSYTIFQNTINGKDFYIFYGVQNSYVYKTIKHFKEYGLNIVAAESELTALVNNLKMREKQFYLVFEKDEKTFLIFIKDNLIIKIREIEDGNLSLLERLSEKSGLKIEKEEKFVMNSGISDKSNEFQKEQIELYIEKIFDEIDLLANEVSKDYDYSEREILFLGETFSYKGVDKKIHENKGYKVLHNSYHYSSQVSSFANVALGGLTFRSRPEDESYNLLSEEMNDKINQEIQEHLEKKESETVEEVQEEKSLTVPEVKTTPKRYSLSLRMTNFFQSLFIITVILALITWMVNYSYTQNLDQQISQSKIDDEKNVREYFAYSYQLVLSNGASSISSTQEATLLAKFSTITLEVKDKFDVLNAEGKLSEEETVNAKLVLENKIKQLEGYEKILKLKTSETVIQLALNYQETSYTYDKKINQETKDFTATLKAKVDLAIVDKDKLELIQKNKLDKTKRKSEFEVEYKITQSYKLVEFDKTKGVSKINVLVDVIK